MFAHSRALLGLLVAVARPTRRTIARRLLLCLYPRRLPSSRISEDSSSGNCFSLELGQAHGLTQWNTTFVIPAEYNNSVEGTREMQDETRKKVIFASTLVMGGMFLWATARKFPKDGILLWSFDVH